MARRYVLARGVCPRCDGEFSLRLNGSLRKHGKPACIGAGHGPVRQTKRRGRSQPHDRRSPPLVPVA